MLTRTTTENSLHGSAGEYRRDVHLLRKYLGDTLIATYQEKLQMSGLSGKKIEQIEVNRFLQNFKQKSAALHNLPAHL